MKQVQQTRRFLTSGTILRGTQWKLETYYFQFRREKRLTDCLTTVDPEDSNNKRPRVSRGGGVIIIVG
jgi:hypothetical protein